MHLDMMNKTQNKYVKDVCIEIPKLVYNVFYH